MTFEDFNLCSAINRALEEKGYQLPTPIQQKAIPLILTGKDVIASANTGSGKTAAFCVPILERLTRDKTAAGVRALVLTPTRELAIQVQENLKHYGRNLSIKSLAIYGGVSQHAQVQALQKGVDVVVATPGRLQDLLNQNVFSLKHLQILVLDEADRMLDMGFINDIKKIIKILPTKRQNILFSATMPIAMQSTIESFVKDPVRVNIDSASKKTDIDQSVYYVDRESKRDLLKHVIVKEAMKNVIVFARTKHGADKIAKDLVRFGIPAESFHGDKTQNARQRALTNFKKNTTRVLVATDIAARGIDIADLPFVINYEMPQSAETYTHRIGRTGRAGQSGSAISFCDRDERGQLNNINRVASQRLKVVEHPFI